ncbi:MAG: crosslink repair DNA glycosylase YcaQ family protein [Rhodospirillaceae bacterium]
MNDGDAVPVNVAPFHRLTPPARTGSITTTMTDAPLDIAATDARRLVLDLQGLAESPRRRLGREGLRDLSRRLGLVQVDSIQWVERAHHMILASRWDGYRQKDLLRLIESDRALFENWMHDASILPIEFFPVWRRRFAHEGAQLTRRWASWHGDDYREDLDHVLAHAAENRPITAREMSDERDPAGAAGDGEWWNWKPLKTALEYHWRTGGLCICHRPGFQKAYDLTERVIPEAHRRLDVDTEAYVDWSCREALNRLSFGTPGEGDYGRCRLRLRRGFRLRRGGRLRPGGRFRLGRRLRLDGGLGGRLGRRLGRSLGFRFRGGGLFGGGSSGYVVYPSSPRSMPHRAPERRGTLR